MVGGWAILLDLHGAVVSATPPSAKSYARRIWGELHSSRPEGIHFSLSLVDRGQNIAVQPVSSQGRVEAYLAVGKKEALTQFDRIVSSHAIGLLAIELAKVRAVSETERRLRGDALEQILSGSLERRRRPAGCSSAWASTWSVRSPRSRARRPLPADQLAEACEEAMSRRAEAFLCSDPRRDRRGRACSRRPRGSSPASATAVGDRARDLMTGAGSLVLHDQLQQTVREARYALQVCQTEGRPEAEFRDLGTYQLLLSLQDPQALATFASSVLGPLDEYDEGHGGHLIPSLQAFLERNARWEAAAAELYVHRHTLRYRMRKVEELTGRDLTSARDRMELFLALRARDLLASADGSDGRGAGLAPKYKANGALAPSGPRRARRKG